MKEGGKQFVETQFKALGTGIYVQIVLEDKRESAQAKKSLKEIREIYHKKERIFSRFDPKSELNRFNNNLGSFMNGSWDFILVARKILHFHKMSNGLFDPRIVEYLEKYGYSRDFKKPKKVRSNLVREITGSLEDDLRIQGKKACFCCRMDFAGLAKGYITDFVASYLIKSGWRNFLVDSGGDMRILGKNKQGKNWIVSIEEISEEKITFSLSDKGIATSGITRKHWEIDGKKYHHLINPSKPNDFSFELKSVTVVSKNAEIADGIAKILMLMQKNEAIKFALKNKIKCVILDDKDNVWMSPLIKKYLFKINL